MPVTRKLTPEELLRIKAAGHDVESYRDKEVTLYTDEELKPQQPMGAGEAAVAPLKAHAGGLVGGGAAGIGTGLALSGTGVGAPIGIPLIIASALAGSYLGQKGQEAVIDETTQKELEEKAQQAYSERPVISNVSEFVTGATLGGGALSPSTALRGTKAIVRRAVGDTFEQQAAKTLTKVGTPVTPAALNAAKQKIAADAINIGIQAGVMPAINTGIGIATTGKLPSAGELALQTIGGALFAKPNVLGRIGNRPVTDTAPEPNSTTDFKVERNLATDTGLSEIITPDPEWDITKLGAKPSFGNDIVLRLVEKRPSNIIAVKRILPELNLSDEVATDLLNRVNRIREKAEIELPSEKMLKTAEEIPAVEQFPKTKEVTVAEEVVPQKTKWLQNEDGTFEVNNEQVKNEWIRRNYRDPKMAKDVAEAEAFKAHNESIRKNVDVTEMRRQLHEEDSKVVGEALAIEKKLSKAQAMPEEESFFALSYEMVKGNFGGLTPNKNGAFNGDQLVATLKNKLTPIEWDILQKGGIEKFKGRIVNKAEVSSFIKDTIPSVEVVSYGMEGKVSEAKKEYDRMTHEWADTRLDTKKRSDLRSIRYDANPSESAKWLKEKQGWNDEDVAKALKWKELWDKTQNEPSDISPRATTTYEHVSAFPTNEPMPEWTATKSGKNVQRVDVVIPQGKRKPYSDVRGIAPDKQHLEPALWQPDNLHENLPNTLGWAMIQYKTGPNGEKIAVITEAQSRWGQAVREAKAALAKSVRSLGAGMDAKKDHPLLHDYNRLILKAAIEQARKEGATHIMVSDAETAMMTEGHDLQHNSYSATPENVELAKRSLEGLKRQGYNEKDYSYKQLEKLANGESIQVDSGAGRLLQSYKLRPALPQESGMRLNYDTILPKIAEELTGQKGKKISLGEHKNAYSIKEGGRIVDVGQTEPRLATKEERLRQNLIFKNADGTPKTDVSGLLFPLTNTKDRYSLFNKSFSNEPKVDTPLYIPVKLQHSLKVGGEDVRSTIQELASTPDHPVSELMRSWLKTKDQEGLDVRLVVSDTETRSYYSPSQDIIVLSKNSLHNARVLVEELAHGLSVKKIPNYIYNGKGVKLLGDMYNYINGPKNDINVKELLKSYIDTIKHLEANGHKGLFDILFGDRGIAGTPDAVLEQFKAKGWDTEIGYSIGDFAEFMAQAFKNKNFQELLNSIKTGETTIFQRFMKAIKNILGVDVKTGSMLEKVLNHTQELIGKERTTEAKSIATAGDNLSFAPPSPDDSRQGLIKGLAATFDKVRQVDVKLSNAFHAWRARREQYKAWGTTAVVDLQKLNNSISDTVMSLHREAFRNNASTLSRALSPEEQVASKILTEYYHDKLGIARRNLGYRINGKEAGLNPFYVPDMLNDRVLSIFEKKATSPEAQHLKNIWAQHVSRESKGAVSITEAREHIDDYVSALGGKDTNYRSVQFGAIRKAQGYGLPESMRETNAVKTLSKYSNRAATDLATYQELETNPDIAGMLKLHDPRTGKIAPLTPGSVAVNDAVQVRDAMKWVTGSYHGQMSTSSPKIAALVRVVNNALLGAPTGIRDTMSIGMNALPYVNKWGDLRAFVKGFQELRINSRRALETGATQPSIDKVQFDSAMDGGDRLIVLLNKIGTGLRKWQGREAIENFNRDITFSVGRELAKTNVIAAKAGDVKAKKFLEKFGLLVGPNITSLTGDSLENALNQMAKNFTDRNQGTYGGSGLPIGMVESQFAPFWALQKWSVEKSNVIYQDVYKPFVTGENRIPMLTYLLGSVMTGAAIQQLNELISGKKAQDPTIKEALDKGDAKAIAAEIATIMQLGSFTGIVGDALKFASDIGLRGKTPRNIISFPTATAAVDLQQRTSDMLEAIRMGENPFDVIKEYSIDMFTHNVQNLRVLANHTIREENVERTNKFRDMRVFNELENKSATEIPTSNPYLGMQSREFKREADVSKAPALAKELVQRIVTENKDNPAELLKKLKGLKANSYNIMPNIVNNPVEFQRYLNFIRRTQGYEAANKLLKDYLRQNAINKAKSSLIP